MGAFATKWSALTLYSGAHAVLLNARAVLPNHVRGAIKGTAGDCSVRSGQLRVLWKLA